MIVFKVSFLLVASVAVFVGTQININLSRKRKSSIQIPENDDLIFQQEQGEDREKDKFEDSNLEPKQEEGEIKSSISKAKHDKKWKDVTEIEILKHRKVTLEVKLLELYGLKEQKIYTSQLQSQLKAKMGEIDMLNVTLNALYSEIEKLHEEIEQNELAKEELEIDKRAIWEIQAKARGDQEQMKGQLGIIKDQVFGFRVDEMKSINGDDFKVEKRLKAMKDVEFEVLKLRRKNKEFELEKRELAIKLDAAEARITVLSNMTESKLVADMKEEISNLSLANKKLTKQVEKLHKNRFSMVEELVYLKWLNTTMRIEVQNYHNPPEKKSKTRITNNSSTDYSFRSVSSSESDKITGSTTFDSSSSSQKSAVKKFNLIRSIKRWGRSKDDLSAISSPPSTTKKVRRFSASMVPSKTSFRREKMQDPNTRARRVSFQDLLDAEEMVENDEQIISAKGSKERIVHTDIRNEFGGGLDKKEPPVLLSSVKFDVVKSNDSSKSGGLKIDEIASAEELPSVVSDVPLNDHNKVGDQMVHFIVAVLFFFVLMLLVYFIDLNCGIY